MSKFGLEIIILRGRWHLQAVFFRRQGVAEIKLCMTDSHVVNLGLTSVKALSTR